MASISIIFLAANCVLPLVAGSAVAPPARYKFAETELGTVYSTLPPHDRRSDDQAGAAPRYHFADSQFGTVYTNIPPAKRHEERDASPTPGKGFIPMEQDGVDAYIKEHHPDIWEAQHSGDVVKRDADATEVNDLQKRRVTFAMTVACMFECHLNQAGIDTLTIAQQVQFCLSFCVTLGEASSWTRVRYGRDYGNVFPATSAG